MILNGKSHVLLTMPRLISAIRSNAPTERSIEFPFLHVGHASAIVTTTDCQGITKPTASIVSVAPTYMTVGRIDNFDLLTTQGRFFTSVPVTVCVCMMAMSLP
jgi:hypothetical protein